MVDVRTREVLSVYIYQLSVGRKAFGFGFVNAVAAM